MLRLQKVLTLSLFPLLLLTQPPRKIQFSGKAQGTTYHITYYAQDTLVSQIEIDSILEKIDSSLSIYKTYSLISHFNESPSTSAIDEHLRVVVKKAIATYRDTGGLFDITVEPLTEAWGFGPKRPVNIPDSATIRNILPCVSTALLSWKGKDLYKQKACVRLDPNGIAQGYTVDVIAGFLETHKVHDYLVEVGGELRIKGRKPNNELMTVGIEAPGEDAELQPMEKLIQVSEGAITTSGNYRRYYESNGQKISHLLDPHTGFSIHNELISVTIWARDAITADAYDNAIMGMGLKRGLAFIEARPFLAAHFIYLRADGSISDTSSKRFRRFLKP